MSLTLYSRTPVFLPGDSRDLQEEGEVEVVVVVVAEEEEDPNPTTCSSISRCHHISNSSIS